MIGIAAGGRQPIGLRAALAWKARYDLTTKAMYGSAFRAPSFADAQNTGTQNGHGTELEAEWQATDTLTLLSHYAFQKSQDEALNHDAGYVPHRQIYWRANRRLAPQAKWIIGRSRSGNDIRPSVCDHTWVDLALRRRRLADHWEVAFPVRSLFGVDGREPSLAGRTAAAIPNDLPLAGRSIFGEVRFPY